MKNKKFLVFILIAVIIVACVGIVIGLQDPAHEHSYSEWETKTPATCESAEIEVRKCDCGQEETREGDPATGHNMQETYDENGHWTACDREGCDEETEKIAHVAESISAVSNIETPMATMVVQVSDLTVTAACGCGASFPVIDGIELEAAPLVLGENTITVKYGELSTTLTIEAAEVDIALDGIVSDDTYVSSSSGTKDNEYTLRNELGTNLTSFRAYFRVNVSDILNSELFVANKENAKVQLILAVTSGSITEETTFTLKAYPPAAGVTDVDIAALTWNSVDNKVGSTGTYSQLHWKYGTELVSSGVGHNVSVDEKYITITLSYNQIADYIDNDGNILFAFATNTSGLKIGSLENETEANRPAFRVVLNDEHFHVFDQEAAQRMYRVSAKCGKKAKYYKSCSCGEAGTDTFEYGGVIAHSYISIAVEAKLTNPMASMVVKASDISVTGICGVCGKSYAITDGIKLEGATTLALGENTITVKYGKLSTTLTIKAEEMGTVLDGTVKDDTYVFSDSKGKAYADKTEMGTNVKSYRSYFRVNVSNILNNQEFLENKDHAKVQLILAITSGSVTEDTTFTLKAYTPATGVTDVNFSKLTWNSVDNKEGSTGTYSQLHWSNGTELVSGGVGNSVTVKSGFIIITLDYSQIKDFVDGDGNILFVFATNTSGLKVGSLENETEANRPAFKIVLSDEHVHVFDQEVVEEKYLASANNGEKAKYYKSCSCGEVGTETFEYGEIIAHSYISISAESKLEAPKAGMVVQTSDLSVTATCGECGGSFTVTNDIELEGATLVPGKNTVTVKYGELSTTVTIEVAEASAVLDGTVSADTYVFASSKDSAYADKTDMGTKSDLYRVYFRVNVRDILENEIFAANNAKAQLILTITSGSVTEDTTFTLKAYAPAAGATDVDFSKLTWNSVDSTKGAYSQLHWNNGTVLEPSVSVNDGKITLTLTYSQIKDFVDGDGNILFVFATNTSGLKVGSLENETEANRPAFKVVISNGPVTHEHAYGEWETKTPAACTDDKVQVRKCSCGEEETQTVANSALGHNMVTVYDETNHWTECDREGCNEATANEAHSGGVASTTEQAVCTVCGQPYGELATHEHTFTSISAESKLENPMATMVVQVSDLTVTATCGSCGKSFAITDGIKLEGATTLALGENEITVKYGELSTTLTIQAVKLDVTLNGTVRDDTYVSSDKKGVDLSGNTEMGTKSDSLRVYFRVNISDALSNERFSANNAKVQLILAITTEGELSENTTFTLKAYAPNDVNFSDITWNSVDKSSGAYKELHWNNGKALVDTEKAGTHVSVESGVITITVEYSQIKDYIDKNGNILLAFATNTKNLKVGSLENETEANRPVVQVVINDDHFHVFDQEAAEEKYLASANCGEKAKYYKSCSCGEAGTETFEYDEVIAHSYTDKTVKEDALKAPETCASGALYYYSCAKCGEVNRAEGAKTFVSGDPTGIHTPAGDDGDCTTEVTCSVCGETTTEGLTHNYTGEWLKDETGHWHTCGNEGCTIAEEVTAHSSLALATETEDEVCQHCQYVMRSALGHTHQYNVQTVSEETKAGDATCKQKATYYYSCSCNDVNKAEGADTFEYGELAAHSPNEDDGDCTTEVTCSVCGETTTKGLTHDYDSGEWRKDETGHWYACQNGGCTATGTVVEHSGGTATTTEQAVCEVCGQPYGALKQEVTVTVSGKIIDDTYVDSGNKEKDFSTSKTELNTNSGSFRAYFRVNISDALKNEQFKAFKDKAKLQLILAVTSGSITEETTFTLKAYTPATGVTDVAFSNITWSSVNNKEGSEGAYSQLHWNNGKALVDTEKAGTHVSVESGVITITLAYSQIKDFVDGDGNILFVFATNTSGLKVGSLENETEANKPVVQVVINDDN